MKVYSSKPYFKQELSRANFLMSRLLSFTGEVTESQKCKQEALRLYKSVASDDTRSDADITSDDFDAIVTYASR